MLTGKKKIATIMATEATVMGEINFVNTRDLKNKTSQILRAAEKGKIIIVTRHGQPVATIKPFQERDLDERQHDSIYQKLRANIAQRYPALLAMAPEELRHLNDEISQKVRGFASWQEMERTAKGDRYGLSR